MKEGKRTRGGRVWQSAAAGRCSNDARSRSSSSQHRATSHSRNTTRLWRAARTRSAPWRGLTRSRSVSVPRSRGDVISGGSHALPPPPFLPPSLILSFSISPFCPLAFSAASIHSPPRSFSGYLCAIVPSDIMAFGYRGPFCVQCMDSVFFFTFVRPTSLL